MNVSLSPLSFLPLQPIGGRLVHVGALQVVRASVIAERLFKRSLCYNTDSYVEASRVLARSTRSVNEGAAAELRVLSENSVLY